MKEEKKKEKTGRRGIERKRCDKAKEKKRCGNRKGREEEE